MYDVEECHIEQNKHTRSISGPNDGKWLLLWGPPLASRAMYCTTSVCQSVCLSDCTRGSDVNKMSACWHRNVVCWFFISCVISNVVIFLDPTGWNYSRSLPVCWTRTFNSGMISRNKFDFIYLFITTIIHIVQKKKGKTKLLCTN